MSSKQIISEKVTEDYSKDSGYTWTIASRDPSEPAIEIWRDGDFTFIRQEFDGVVDLVSFDPGQTYDLTAVLTRLMDLT